MMDTLRVSATDIDALRYFMAQEDGDIAALLSRLRREDPPTEPMMAGTALHHALENAADGDYDELASDGYTFRLEIDGELDLPYIREIKSTKEFMVSDCAVTLVGKVDAVLGKRVDDHKFTSRFDPERFFSSYQWRIYLDIFGADEFRWNVFEGRGIGPKQYAIKAMHPLTMYRYPGMKADIEQELRTFVTFARDHLPERFNARVAQ